LFVQKLRTVKERREMMKKNEKKASGLEYKSEKAIESEKNEERNEMRK